MILLAMGRDPDHSKPLDPFRVVTLLFGMALAVFAAWPVATFLGKLTDYLRLSNAVPVPARVVDVRQDSYPTAGSTSGGSAPRLTVERSGNRVLTFHAAYAYTWLGREFTSRKLTLFGNPARFSGMLNAALDEKSAITCYVDPDSPSLSVLDRDFRWGPVGGAVVFAAIFLLLCRGLFALVRGMSGNRGSAQVRSTRRTDHFRTGA